MTEPNILVIEDEEDIVQLLKYNLNREGFQVSVALNGIEGLQKARLIRPDLVLLDLMLPELNGLEVCRRLKAEPATRSIPVIMLTAKGDESDIVTGLELGADDYIPKPFSPRVLLARIRAVVRRFEHVETIVPEDLVREDLVIRPGQHQVLVSGEEVHLTHMEFRLLETLAGRAGWVFTRNQIVTAIRGEGYAVTDRAVDVLVVGLRKKLGKCSHYIETVRGVGYRFREL